MNCNICNEPLDQDWDDCPACGTAVKREITCIACGRILKENWIKCPVCKTPIGKSSFPSVKKSLRDYGSYLIGSFNEGKARIVVKEDDLPRFGFIENSGTIIINPVYAYAENFRNNLAIVQPCIGDCEYYGMIDPAGKEILPPIHLNLIPQFDNVNLIGAERNDGGAGFYDINGNVAIPFVYDKVMPFSDGLAAVCRDKKFGFINRIGKMVISCNYDWVESFHEDFAVFRNNGVYGFVDKMGRERMLDKYSSISSFTDGVAIVADENENYGLIDTSGIEILPCNALYMDYADEGLIWVVNQDYFGGFIDNKANMVIPMIYEADDPEISCFQEGLAGLCRNGKYGFIDKTGNTKIPFEYDKVTFFSEGLSFFKKGEEKGYMDKTGKPAIKLDRNIEIYPRGFPVMNKTLYNYFHDGLAYLNRVENNYLEVGWIDRHGNQLWC